MKINKLDRIEKFNLNPSGLKLGWLDLITLILLILYWMLFCVCPIFITNLVSLIIVYVSIKASKDRAIFYGEEWVPIVFTIIPIANMIISIIPISLCIESHCKKDKE